MIKRSFVKYSTTVIEQKQRLRDTIIVTNKIRVTNSHRELLGAVAVFRGINEIIGMENLMTVLGLKFSDRLREHLPTQRKVEKALIYMADGGNLFFDEIRFVDISIQANLVCA